MVLGREFDPAGGASYYQKTTTVLILQFILEERSWVVYWLFCKSWTKMTFQDIFHILRTIGFTLKKLRMLSIYLLIK